jgi:predicted unusual protein kinase regulating ubiquinone biosynthesis (AarF/ABC1/UbiB family)
MKTIYTLKEIFLQVDKEFRIISDAYPYIASRLLTDPSEELQSALQQLLFKDVPLSGEKSGIAYRKELRWDRLQELMEEASSTTDYDASLAADLMLTYLTSDRGKPIREILSVQMVEVVDQLGDESTDLLLRGELASVLFRSNNDLDSRALNLSGVLDRFVRLIEKENEKLAETSPTASILALAKVIKIMQTSNRLNSDKISNLVRKV